MQLYFVCQSYSVVYNERRLFHFSANLWEKIFILSSAQVVVFFSLQVYFLAADVLIPVDFLFRECEYICLF